MRETWASFTPEEWELIREGGRLGMEVPEIRARTMNEFSRVITVMAGALARRVGRPPDDLRVRVLAGAVMGVMMAVFLPEHLAADAGAELVDDRVFGPDSVSRIDEALALLEEGLPL